ncbi:MAG: YrhB domain-containing protein [Spirochaetota bacterium]
MPINFEDAKRIAKEHLKKKQGGSKLAITEATEYEDRWCFMYNTRKFVETNDYFESLLGNHPFDVFKKDGEVAASELAKIEGYDLRDDPEALAALLDAAGSYKRDQEKDLNKES